MALTHQQTYLLNRLPGRYSQTYEAEVEPLKVQAARKVIEAWEDRQRAKKAEASKKWDAALNAVREAIYFKSPTEALKAVKEFEEKFGVVGKV